MDELNIENLTPDLAPKGGLSRWIKISLAIFFGILVIFGGLFVTAFSYTKKYQDRIYPGVYVGHYHLGGMNSQDLKNFIETVNNRLAKDGINLDANVEGKKTAIKINTVSLGENSTELINLDSAKLWQKAYSLGHDGNRTQKLFYPLFFRLNNKELSVPMKIDQVNLVDILNDSLSDLVDQPRNAGIKIVAFNPLRYEIIPEKNGLVFSYDKIIKEIELNLGELYLGNIFISPEQFEAQVKIADAQKSSEKLQEFLNYGDVVLTFVDPQTKINRDWKLTAEKYGEWIEIQIDEKNQPIFILNEQKVKNYLESLRPLVDKLAQDAKFTVTPEGKVNEFQAAQTGLLLNVDKTFADLNNIFKGRNYQPAEVVKSLALSVEAAEPVVSTADVNNLGIKEIMGVGYSTFKDSHTNRIKNIAHAVKRLNGTLIKPGEEFSAIRFAGPFTAENGFLPEAVIKGNEIKNEIGGGMCQIGTTLFRMAMNSGMDITQRRNHSLVVGYYADPVNGNPGTDATLYEPSLDLKFKNDTGNYLLLQTDIDFKKQQLTFTLWGSNDGRKGWYTHPLVSKWIPAGEPQEIKTEKLKPGVKNCQAAFRGAVASFTYTRVLPSGEKVDRVFESYYRPLPKICMVGVDPTVVGDDAMAPIIESSTTIEY